MTKTNTKIFFTKFKQILKITIPILLGYIPLGFCFGFLASQSGIPIFVSALMSVFMYAGAGQYMAVGLLAANAGFSTIIITEFLLNLRHIVYGLSLISEFSDTGKCKPYLIFALTDETYSVLTTAKIPENMSKKFFYAGVSVLNQIYWIAGSLAGAFLGASLQNSTNFDFGGIDFVLTALFAVLFTERLRKPKAEDSDENEKQTAECEIGIQNENGRIAESNIRKTKIKSKNRQKLSDDAFASIIGAICCIFSVFLWKFGAIKNASNILLAAIMLSVTVILILKTVRNKNHRKIN